MNTIVNPYKIYLKLCTFLMIIISSDTLDLFKEGGAREQGVAGRAIEYTGPINYIIPLWLMMSAPILFFLLIKELRKIKARELNLVPISFLALSFLSIAWADDKYVMFRTALLIFFAYALIFIQARTFTIKQNIYFLSNVLLGMQVFSLLMILFAPSYGIAVGEEHAGKWQGMFNHKNTLGSFSVLAYCIFMGRLKISYSLGPVVGALLSIALALGSQSFTAVGAIALSTVIFILFGYRKALKIAFTFRRAILITTLLISGSMVFVAVANINSIGIFGKDTSFTGRNLIWGYLLVQTLKSPVIGHGLSDLPTRLASSTGSTDFQNSVGFVVGTAHNGFIEAIYALGGLGIIYIYCFLAKMVVFSKPQINFMLNLTLLMGIVIINTFESKFFSFNSVFIMMLFAIEMNYRKN